LIVTLGAIGGLSSTIIVMLLGQSRILYAMSNDGLLPAMFRAIHPRYRTPYKSSILVGLGAAAVAGFVPIDVLAEMVSIGTLLAFAGVCIGILVLRHTRPDQPRPFRTPWVPFVPIMGILITLLMMFSLTRPTWIRLGTWFVIGIAIYFGYGHKHSRVQQPRLSPSGVVIGFDQDSPEQEFLWKLLRGAVRVLIAILGLAAAASFLATFFPLLEERFDRSAAALSIAAIFVGLGYALAPELKSLWLLRKQKTMDESALVDEASIREFVKSLEKTPDSSNDKE
jgi:hypothetical protein